MDYENYWKFLYTVHIADQCIPNILGMFKFKFGIPCSNEVISSTEIISEDPTYVIQTMKEWPRAELINLIVCMFVVSHPSNI